MRNDLNVTHDGKDSSGRGQQVSEDGMQAGPDRSHTRRKMKEREKATTVFHADMVLRNGGCAGLDPTHDLPVCTLEQFSCLDDR
jgi:hypothetical protein